MGHLLEITMTNKASKELSGQTIMDNGGDIAGMFLLRSETVC